MPESPSARVEVRDLLDDLERMYTQGLSHDKDLLKGRNEDYWRGPG